MGTSPQRGRERIGAEARSGDATGHHLRSTPGKPTEGTGLLRIHFTHDDLTRVRIARAPDPLAETVLSLSLVQTRDVGGVALEGWRSRTRKRLRPELRVLFDLATAAGATEAPEAFLHAGTDSLANSLDHTWSLPRQLWSADLGALEYLRPGAPRWIRDLHRGDREWRGLVHRRLSEYHAFAVAPYWSQLLAAAHLERTGRALVAADTGLDGLLGSLHPDIRWESPVLSLPCPVDADVPLRGTGIVLVPTFFWPEPLALTDNRGPDHPLVLHYPLTRDLATYRTVWASAAAEEPDGATVLRSAGLLTTERTGPGVRHTLTPLGQALLDDRP